MILRYTILYVDNVAATLSFYEEAFGLTRSMLHESGDYGELATGETKLAFSSIALMRKIGKIPGIAAEQDPSFEIAFETENVKAALQRVLKVGAELVQDVEEMPWGQTTSYIRDINGFLVEICSPVYGAS
jgi:lactoylglutathione lyase